MRKKQKKNQHLCKNEKCSKYFSRNENRQFSSGKFQIDEKQIFHSCKMNAKIIELFFITLFILFAIMYVKQMKIIVERHKFFPIATIVFVILN